MVTFQLTRAQLLRRQVKAAGIILALASLLGITEGVVASYWNFWNIPTDLFAAYNFLILGVGGVFLTRAVLFNVGLVRSFIPLSRAKIGLIRTLANAAVFPIILDTWSQAIQVLYQKPLNTPYYVVLTSIFPRYDWEGSRYGGLGTIFGMPTAPFNFPFWFYIWIAGLVAYHSIDVIRLYGVDIGRLSERLFARLLPARFVWSVQRSLLGRSYLHIRPYARISFKSVT